jgi:hypothetical protein
VYEASGALFLAVNFLGWSLDGKRIAMMMTKRNMRDDHSVSSDYDLMSVDPATFKAEYVATIHREGGMVTLGTVIGRSGKRKMGPSNLPSIRALRMIRRLPTSGISVNQYFSPRI